MRRKACPAAGFGLTLILTTLSAASFAEGPNILDSHVQISEFEGHLAACDPPTPPVDVIELPGGVQIITFVNTNNVWVTGNPLVDGIEENRVVARFDPESPNIEARVKVTLDVAAVDGVWKIRQFLVISPEGTTGFAVGLGRGDLRGKLIVYGNDTPSPFLPLENPPCEVPPGYPADQIVGLPLKGRVITFGWTG